MRVSKIILSGVLAAVFTLNSFAESTEEIVTYDRENVGVEISDTMYGIFFEDINYAGDGGLYPEYVQNRSFENHDIESGISSPSKGWILNSGKEGEGEHVFMTTSPINENNLTYLNLNISKAPYRLVNYGFTNSGNPDMYIKENEKYDLIIYLRNRGFNGQVKISLLDKNDNLCSDEVIISEISDEWTKHTSVLTAQKSEKVKINISFDGTGEIEADYISLMGQETWGYSSDKWKYGGLRKDLVEVLKDLNPGFLRFPGGCIVEGAYRHDTHYDWKNTIGEPENRKENANLWGYGMTYGLGYHEYFQLAEDLGAEPVPVLHAGILCQARNNGSNTEENWKEGDKEFDALIQDYLDLIEYANGDVTTKYGAMRAENGHPEPFELKMIGVGNENWDRVYWRNFAVIYDKLQSLHPEITIITTSGPLSSGWINEMAWGEVDKNYRNVIVDEHYYESPEWFLQNIYRYDIYDRESAKVFLGEFAAHDTGKKNTVYAAVCEAAFMTGLEKNADVVIMSSYAPLLARATMQQWAPDLIWFNSKEVTNLTPSYHVQKLFSAYHGKMTLPINGKLPKNIYGTTSFDDNEKKIYTKLVNTSDESISVNLVYENFSGLSDKFSVITAMGKKSETEFKFHEDEHSLINNSLTFEVPAYSVNVLEIDFGVLKQDETINVLAEESVTIDEISEQNENKKSPALIIIIAVIFTVIVLILIVITKKLNKKR